MRKDNLLSILLGRAALLLMAVTALGVTSCSQDNEEPGGTLPEGKITLVPTVASATTWNAATDAVSKSDATIGASLTGGEVFIALMTTDQEPKILGCNYYSVSADGKLTRLPFNSRPNETETPLSVDAPGQYVASGEGQQVTLTTDGISYRAYVRNEVALITIGTDGKLSMPFPIESGGLRLDVKNTDGIAYTGADITAKPLTVTASGTSASFEVKTLTAGAPAAIWGDISSSGSVNAGEPLLELTVSGGKAYHVNAPRQITFSRARLYTFNVRVGATGITVSSDDLGIADFEAVEVTNVEAEPVPLYEGQPAKLLAIPGRTAYWVAPVDADTSAQWGSIDSNTCPAGWHVPTKDEFVAMTGIPADASDHSENKDAIKAVFPGYNTYWSSAEDDNINAWYLGVNTDGTSYISKRSKEGVSQLRCVRRK